ncbi:hypothetical protein [Pseudomonas sp. URMO17WK12:I6]|jgi:hypothetical protein|uniref:hypothetical protein n=1 Tax=Pseudomonas sp. URMO17WK12:I6 TaxID=1261629 RepID=UPI000DAD7FFF|nr:hypothetical protein [Pseudomonas sp. URMO17WK12:I6]
MSEDDIYLQLGHILLDTSPAIAMKVIVEAELSPENDHCQFLFDYVDEDGKQDWFSPVSAQVDSELFDCLVELRKIYIQNGITGGCPIWSGCVITLDVAVSKLAVEFKYD